MKNILLMTCMILLSVSIQAQQQVLTSSGSLASTENGSLSWTVGEMMTSSWIQSEVMLTQGFQQSQLRVTNIFETDGLKGIQVYPNPVKDLLNLRNDSPEVKTMIIKLIDMNGRILEAKDIHTDEYQIDFSKYAAGSYILEVIDTEHEIMGTYKILKH